MKMSLKVALLASVLMASPVLAADKNDNSPTDMGRNEATQKAVKLDENGNPIHRKHMKKHAHKMDENGNYVNRDGRRGYRDANGNWHDADGERMYNNGNPEYRDAGYNDYYNRSGQRKWMGINLDARHMTDGSDNDANNRGRHAFIFDNGKNSQDFRVGSGHVVKH